MKTMSKRKLLNVFCAAFAIAVSAGMASAAPMPAATPQTTPLVTLAGFETPKRRVPLRGLTRHQHHVHHVNHMKRLKRADEARFRAARRQAASRDPNSICCCGRCNPGRANASFRRVEKASLRPIVRTSLRPFRARGRR
jgi:hypothetical protein